MRQAFGGPITGDIPTHFIPPGQPGFEEAGGEAGPGVDFLAKPEGDMELAAEYMKKAGFDSGKYDGGKTFSGVSDNATVQAQVGEVAVAQFEKLGFKRRWTETPDAMRPARTEATLMELAFTSSLPKIATAILPLLFS